MIHDAVTGFLRHPLKDHRHFRLGYIDLEQKTLQTIDNPFGTRLSPMPWVHSVSYVSGSDNMENGGPGRTRTCDNAVMSGGF